MKHFRNRIISFTHLKHLTLLLLFFSSCTNNSDITRPDGWEMASHSKAAIADYSIVFPQVKVNRIDISISTSDWQAMLKNMTTLAGETGKAMTADSAESPCDGEAEGATCDINTPMGKRPGTCRTLIDRFDCVPNVIMRFCESDAEIGEECTVPTPVGVLDGTCLPLDGQIPCVPNNDALSNDNNTNENAMDFSRPLFVPCTVSFEGREWTQVGVRFKGYSTLKMTWYSGQKKLPFKLDFDQFEDVHPEITDQRFFGFKKLSFTNNAMDPSYLKDKIAGDVFREGGVPTPRRSFYRVFGDTGNGPVYWGLYTVAEVPGKPFFKAQFDAASGNLYKPEGDAATWRISEYPVDETSFSKKNNANESTCSDINAAISALHQPRDNPALWRKELESFFDPYRFLKWLAINTVIQDWDTYGNMPHNYYLYGNPTNNSILEWIPWDHNESFASADNTSASTALPLDMSSVTDEWPLIRFLMDDDHYAETYRDYVEAFAHTVFLEESMNARLDREHQLISPYVVGAEGELADYTLTDPASFKEALDELKSHVSNRHIAVTAFLELK